MGPKKKSKVTLDGLRLGNLCEDDLLDGLWSAAAHSLDPQHDRRRARNQQTRRARQSGGVLDGEYEQAAYLCNPDVPPRWRGPRRRRPQNVSEGCEDRRRQGANRRVTPGGANQAGTHEGVRDRDEGHANNDEYFPEADGGFEDMGPPDAGGATEAEGVGADYYHIPGLENLVQDMASKYGRPPAQENVAEAEEEITFHSKRRAALAKASLELRAQIALVLVSAKACPRAGTHC